MRGRARSIGPRAPLNPARAGRTTTEPTGPIERPTPVRHNPTRPLLALVALSLLAASCAGAPRFASQPAPTGSAPERLATAAREDGTFHLTVTNQSFEHPDVGIEITLDGRVVIDRPFAVEGQHNFVPFPFDLAPGEHTLGATASTGTTLEETFTLPASGAPRYAVLTYWYYTDDPELYFDWSFRDDPPAFD